MREWEWGGCVIGYNLNNTDVINDDNFSLVISLAILTRQISQQN
jgi:hypothetical protein